MKPSHFRLSICYFRLRAIFSFLATILPFGLSLDLGAAALRFDMGPKGAPVRAEFVQVTAETAYSEQRPYGWAATESLADADYAAPQPSAPIFTDALLRDFVFSDRPATFRVKVSNGTYGVFLVCGTAQAAFAPPFFNVTVRLEGNEVGKFTIPQPRIFERRLYVAQVSDGLLDIEFSTAGACWLVNGIVVFPLADAAQVRDDIQDIGHTIDWLPTQLAAAWQEAKPADEKAFTPSDEQKERGYVLFSRSYEEAGPRTGPRAEDVLGELRLFAAQGEYEPTTLSVWPLRALKQVRVTATDLAGPGASQIPAAQCQVRWVRCIRARVAPDDPTNRLFRLVPWCLEAVRLVDVPVAETQTFWITVKAPEDAAPGVYSGTIRFAPENAHPQDVPLRLRVLPFRLERDPQAVHAVAWQPPFRNSPTASPYAKLIEQRSDQERHQQLADMRDHGLTSVVLSPSIRAAEGQPVLDLDDLGKTASSMRRAGLPGPLILTLPLSAIARSMGREFRLDAVVPVEPLPQLHETVVNLARQVEEHRQTKGWPEIVFLPIDGYVSRWNAEAAAQVLEALRKVPGIKTCALCPYETETVARFARLFDFRCYRLPHGELTPYEERWVRSEAIRFGQKLWLAADDVAAARHGHPSLARFLFGAYAWSVGVTGFCPRAYQELRGAPFNDFAREHGDATFTLPGPDGPLPTLAWEMMREGIDDSRYFHTLEAAIKRAKDSGQSRAFTEALTARRELLTMRDRIPSRDGFLKQSKSGPSVEWAVDNMARYRWRVAWWIQGLNSILAGTEPKPAETGYGQAKIQIVSKPDARDAGAPVPADAPPGRIVCPTISAAPKIDGHLDDACWQNAARVEAFVEGRSGLAPPVRTAACVAADASHLYIAFECFDTDLNAARHCRFGADQRDVPVWVDDAVSVSIDQDHDHRTYFQLVANAAGAYADWRCTPHADWNWNSKARVKTSVLGDRWCAEMAIPRKAITKVDNDIWAVSLARRRHAPACDARQLASDCACATFVLVPPRGYRTSGLGLEAACQPQVGSRRFPDAFWHLVFDKPTCFVSDITRLDLSLGQNVLMARLTNVKSAPLDVIASLGLNFGDKPRKTNYRITLPANRTTEYGFPFEVKAIGKCALAFLLLDPKDNTPWATVVRTGLDVPAPLSFTFDPLHYFDEPQAVGRALIQLTPEAMQEDTKLRATLWPAGKKQALTTTHVELGSARAEVVVPLDALKPGAFEVELALVKAGQDVFTCRRVFVKCEGPFTRQP